MFVAHWTVWNSLFSGVKRTARRCSGQHCCLTASHKWAGQKLHWSYFRKNTKTFGTGYLCATSPGPRGSWSINPAPHDPDEDKQNRTGWMDDCIHCLHCKHKGVETIMDKSGNVLNCREGQWFSSSSVSALCERLSETQGNIPKRMSVGVSPEVLLILRELQWNESNKTQPVKCKRKDWGAFVLPSAWKPSFWCVLCQSEATVWSSHHSF